MENFSQQYEGLYHPSFEKDACGIGFIAHTKGRKSHKIVADAITMLERMDHRGACGYEANSGDGAGILIQIPHEFFESECRRIGFSLPAIEEYGVGFVFFPKDVSLREECRESLNRYIKKLGFRLLGYRIVPTLSASVGSGALSVEPQMEQVFIEKPTLVANADDLERKLYVLRKHATRMVRESVKDAKDFYFPSLSCRTITYKGQLTTGQLKPYFPDLENESVRSALAVVHSRFSTNTFPSWKLAQPFRYIAHNGEINTVKGNVGWIHAQSKLFKSSKFTQEEMEMILPICSPGQSDSAHLDNVIELMVLSGRSLPHVMMMLIPEAWDGNAEMDDERKAFYEAHAALMEPWDGPASITFTDGKIIGATLDRNGLRPSRYWILDNDIVIMASESGVLDIDPAKVLKKGRLQPGKMFIVDTEQGRIIPDEELKAKICSEQPYQEWLEKYKIELTDLPEPKASFNHPYEQDLLVRQQVFGFTTEDLRMILAPMAETSKEALGSMGSDIPLAILSNQSQHLSYYFKQLFAQVTNPPIDSIRERLVMSLVSYVGSMNNLLESEPEHCVSLKLKQPILTNIELEKIRFVDHENFQTKTINIVFNSKVGKEGLQRALDRICQYSEDAIMDGYTLLLLSDRLIDSSHAPIPSLLACSAVHHHLIRKSLRGKVGIIVEAGDIWETHHIATLIGYGASAINPYMAFETLKNMQTKNMFSVDYPIEKLEQNYIKAANGELLKVFSKMGISTLQSYQGAQIFEALGIESQVIDNYFTGTVSRIGGMTIEGIAEEVLVRHKRAFPKNKQISSNLEVGGVYQWKQRGEAHLLNPQTIHLLQQSCRKGDYQLFKKYSQTINNQTDKAITLRSLLKFKTTESIPLEEVEPIENILKRFATGAMSFGSISYEAHTTLAIAMNRIGGKSNCGEGGEDPIRYVPLPNGDNLSSAIKQVASGRFGVTSYYLTQAKELQIKMAQGAKPGEGGQLPGFKVDDWIGRTRHSTPGVGLISPPPHHDIYSIEDLAQLIFDLKNANREARISVKLVSEAGVGTVAAGVAKAHADHILIAGHDGGTGASPLSSIRQAGLPWEMGLAEAHQTLVKNRLRGRVTLQTDGMIRTGRDLAIATLLGAEEWGVATAALISAGCIMMRKCHLNTCPVGVATQNPELRALFTGKPEDVVNMFQFLAMELREVMARLGFRTVNEMVGQVQFLEKRKDITHWKYKDLDLSKILYKNETETALYKQEAQEHGLENQLDWQILEMAKPALEKGKKVQATFKINNVMRTTGAILSNEISKKYQEKGLPENTINLRFEGTAGQSFGAFATQGMTMELVGDANDYVGKGLCGGKIIIYPCKESQFKASENSIVGNVTFYGATSGEAYLRGMAGERFCVRNSGAKVVVEGVGDHGCEYMTGGLAVVLGDIGRNFAAGMSGGVAYIWNVNQDIKRKINTELLESIALLTIEDQQILEEYIKKHFEATKSEVAEFILDNWKACVGQFVKVFPSDFKKALETKNIKFSEQLKDKSIVYKNVVVMV